MYAAIALVLVSSFATAAVVIPLYFPTWQERLLHRLQGAVLCSANRTVLDSGGRRQRELVLCLRLWFLLGAAFFAFLGLIDGAVIRNQPGSIGSVVGYGFLAMGGSSLLILSLLAYAWFLPGVKLYMVLNRCGFRELWLTPFQSQSRDLRHALAARLSKSASVSILDVTGHEIVGRGPGPEGGLLYDLLAAGPRVPVSILLFKPHAEQIDPDRKHATVFQTVLSEMKIAAPAFVKRIRMTLTAIHALNADRPPEAQIKVRFYTEKPTMRAMIFEDSMIVSPWMPTEDKENLTIFDLARSSSTPSFYASFRHNFSRLWKSSEGRFDMSVGGEKKSKVRRGIAPITGSSRYVAVNLPGNAGGNGR